MQAWKETPKSQAPKVIYPEFVVDNSKLAIIQNSWDTKEKEMWSLQ